MKIRMTTGISIALLAAGMGTTGNAAAYPSAPCTAANQNQRVTESNWDGSSRVWQCMEGTWQLYAICDKRGRCTVVI